MSSGRASEPIPARIDTALTRDQLDEALWVIVRSERPLSPSDLLAAMRNPPSDVKGSSVIATLAVLQRHADAESYFAHLTFTRSGNSWQVWASEEARSSYERFLAKQLMGQSEAVIQPSIEQRISETLAKFASVPMWPEERRGILRELADDAQRQGDLASASRLLYESIPAVERYEFIRLGDRAGGVFLAQSHQGEVWVASPLSKVADDGEAEGMLLRALRDAIKALAAQGAAAREKAAAQRRRQRRINQAREGQSSAG